MKKYENSLLYSPNASMFIINFLFISTKMFEGNFKEKYHLLVHEIDNWYSYRGVTKFLRYLFIYDKNHHLLCLKENMLN